MPPDKQFQPTTSSDPPSQKELSQNIDDNTLKQLRASRQTDTHYQAHLNHTSASGAGQWLHAPPSKPLRLNVQPSHYKTMIQRWLRAPIFHEPFHCPLCDDIVDIYGDHCLVCACGGDRTKRHNLLRNQVYYECQSVGLAPELERPGLLQPRPLVGATPENGVAADPNEHRRPADVYIPRWRLGNPAAFDLAATSGLRPQIVAASALDGRTAPQQYEDFKREYLDTERLCQAEGISFIPLVVEADGGGWGAEAYKVFHELAKLKSATTGELESTAALHINQSLNITLHRENARAILRRHPQMVPATHQHTILAAAATLQAQLQP